MSHLTITTKYGRVLTPHQVKAYKTIKKLIEDEESRHATTTRDHLVADCFRSYFKEKEE